ncbi:trimeric intracellular cation channel family protein [Flavobacterium tibetense]|jgi:uncharacterized membrane protein YeiH|uniref:Trimeric intracellular cation channel family protein n=1 Tax=Flavobacterium tibetense TaxID=2233533 RepID=A0A365P105_9FLAO|nr:trimeric intracellular cation channel family protein [Flavobacterium tibetense]RBA28177.1 trimeric intracellular cation channel family protein [Flavobacterium tibetense]
MFEILDTIGTLVFAISGALTAMYKKLDLFGVYCIAFVTALGGGTIRDVMIGRTPVGWMLDIDYVFIITLGFLLSLIFNRYLERLRISLLLFDTIGLGVFTLIGLEKGLEFGLSPVICVILGTLTATFGGVVRDILCNEIPVLFRKEIYATLCIAGGILFFLLQEFAIPKEIISASVAVFIITLRLVAYKYNWSLPIGTVFVKK